MKYIDTNFIHISILDHETVLVEAVRGAKIDHEKSKFANELIANEMPENYGMIINRKADYSIVPNEVYKVLNGLKSLKAIAIVVHDKGKFPPASTEKSLYKGALNTFQTKEQAHQWIKRALHETDRLFNADVC